MKFKVLFFVLIVGFISSNCFYSQIVWNGAVDNDWSTGGNWVGGVVPGAGQNVQISTAGTGNYPVLTGLTTTVDGDLTIDNGTNININAKILVVTGNIDINGTLDFAVNNSRCYVSGNWDDNTGTLSYGAGSHQVRLRGSGTVSQDPSNVFRNLQIENGLYTAASDINIVQIETIFF